MLGGILVGGLSRRMGSPKGLLRAPDGQPIVERWCNLFREIGVSPVLVGRHPAYAHLVAVPCLDDDAPAIGPLGGLLALLRHAGTESAIAVACDMPYVSRRLLTALATHPSAAPIVGPRTAGGWEPLFARYRAPDVLPAATRRAQGGEHSLQGLLDEVGTEPWALDASDLAELRDWDQPSDMA